MGLSLETLICAKGSKGAGTGAGEAANGISPISITHSSAAAVRFGRVFAQIWKTTTTTSGLVPRFRKPQPKPMVLVLIGLVLV